VSRWYVSRHGRQVRWNSARHGPCGGLKKKADEAPAAAPVAVAGAASVDAASAPIVVDAAVTADAAPAVAPAVALSEAEAANRAGKKSGLGAPGEAVEMASETLLPAIADGTLGAAQLVAPARGVVEWVALAQADGTRTPTLKRVCGADAPALVERYAKLMAGQTIECSNYLDVGVPADLARSARCETRAKDKHGASYAIVLEPDPAGVLHVVAINVEDRDHAPSEDELDASAKLERDLAKACL